MCGSIADFQSATAEIRRGKKKIDRKKKKPQGKNIIPALFHRAAINMARVFEHEIHTD